MKEVFIPFAKNHCKRTNPYPFFTFIRGNVPLTGAKARVLVRVEKPPFCVKHGLFVGGGLGDALAAVGVVVYLKKYRL